MKSWKFSIEILLLVVHHSLAHESHASINSTRDYSKGVNERCPDLCVMYRENTFEELERSFTAFHTEIDSKNNRMEIQLEQNIRNRPRILKRRTITKCINECILLMFILHCLFARALLHHIALFY